MQSVAIECFACSCKIVEKKYCNLGSLAVCFGHNMNTKRQQVRQTSPEVQSRINTLRIMRQTKDRLERQLALATSGKMSAGKSEIASIERHLDNLRISINSFRF